MTDLPPIVDLGKVREERAKVRSTAPAAAVSAETRDPLLVDGEEACRLLAVSRTGLWRLVQARQVRPLKMGRATRYRFAELVALVERLEAAP